MYKILENSNYSRTTGSSLVVAYEQEKETGITEIAKENRETSEDGRYVHYFDCGDYLMNEHICKTHIIVYFQYIHVDL